MSYENKSYTNTDITSAVSAEINMELESNQRQGKGVTVSFHDITYEVDYKIAGPCSKTTSKVILDNVSGAMEPGLSAIMGPSGSGKTSLLDVLAGRKDPTNIKNGYVLMNGKPAKEKYVRLSTGYVVQDDVVMATLTVRENLLFSANLRLSAKKYNKEAKEAKVDKLIEELGLTSCADTKVGNELIRGISGGERKRVSIGMELVTDPPVLFLDEPTTGLDAFTAESIMRLLCDLGKHGTTVITSIHQPRYSIFSMFDRTMILSRGQVMYNGPTDKIVDYFGSIGYPCPQFHNPADYLLDVVNGNIRRDTDVVNNSNEYVQDEDVKFETRDSTNHALENEKIKVAKKFAKFYELSDIASEERRHLKDIQATKQQLSLLTTDECEIKTDYANGFLYQLKMLSKRSFIDLVRNPLSFVGQFVLLIIVALILGLVFFQLGLHLNGIQDRSGCIYMLAMIHIMNNMRALDIFIAKKHLFVHEFSGGYYRVSAYFISRVAADLIPYRIIPLVSFTIIAYFMMGFQTNAGKFFFFFLNLSLSTIASTALAFALSTGFNNVATAHAAMIIPLFIFMLFGGFLVNTGSILIWLEWIKWLSLFRYAINGLLVTEFNGLVFINNSSFPGFDPNSQQPCYSSVTNSTIPECMTGEQYLARQNIPYDNWGQWQNPVALAAMCFIYLALSYVQLRRTSVYK